jgi:hypothetical protein
MTAVEVLMECRCAGLRVRAHGDKVQLMPAGRVTPHLVQLVSACKLELLELLRRDRVDELQQECPDCRGLFVDAFGFGRCFACVAPVNQEVA